MEASIGGPVPKLLVREKEGVSLLAWQPESGDRPDFLTRATFSAGYFSADGRMLALVSPEEVQVVDTDSGKEVLKLTQAATVAVAFSPKGTYLQTFQKPTGQSKNLIVRRMDSGEAVLQQFQKAFAKTNWPSVQFSEDETVACRCMSNELQVYDPQGWDRGVVERVKVPNVAAAQLAQSPPSHLAVFVGEAKGAPGSVRIFARPLKPDSPACARRSFFKANSVRLIWNKGSTAVLALAHSDVDKTNQSYYGESTLHFLAADASFEGTVPLSKEGPIHDLQWSPSGKEFVVVHGFMPAKATLFDSRCKPLFDFGSGPRNMVRWSPHGRYICLAGFGNLPGDIEFWDRPQLKSVGTTRAAMGVSLEWAPTGHHVMVATTAPRLQVDNGIRIFACDGTLVHQKSYGLLFQAEWRPSPEGAWPDTPFLPGRAPAVEAGRPQASSLAGEPTASAPSAGPGKAATPAKPAPAYRPPHSKVGGSGSSSLRAQLLGEREAPKVIGEKAGGAASGESKSAAKNRKRREKKAAEEGSEAPGAAAAADAVAEKLAELPTPAGGGDTGEGGSAAAGADTAKKLRALNKKLRQIEELRKKVAGSAGAVTPEQREKLSQEEGLREEIAALERQT